MLTTKDLDKLEMGKYVYTPVADTIEYGGNAIIDKECAHIFRVYKLMLEGIVHKKFNVTHDGVDVTIDSYYLKLDLSHLSDDERTRFCYTYSEIFHCLYYGDEYGNLTRSNSKDCNYIRLDLPVRRFFRDMLYPEDYVAVTKKSAIENVRELNNFTIATLESKISIYSDVLSYVKHKLTKQVATKILKEVNKIFAHVDKKS